MSRARVRIALALALPALLGAAQAGDGTGLPPYVPAYEPRTVDERGLWAEFDEYEQRLRASPLRVDDPGLNDYVRGVLCRAVGEDRCRSVRLYILEVPLFNATMAGNGAMTVWTGLLLRARNEAELAAVLGHEFAHFELRHSLAGFAAARAATDAMAWISVLGGISQTGTAGLETSLLGSFFRFNREQEEAADLLGLKYMQASGYRGAAASEIWAHLMAESDATAAGRKVKSKQRYSAGFFDTHPTELKRLTYLREAAGPRAEQGDAAAEAYRAALAPYLPRLLAAQIKLNDFGGTEYLLNELARGSGWTGDLLFARAEMYRERGNPRDLVTASDFYRQAIAAGVTAPEAYRGLGLSLLRAGEADAGKEHLREYLRLKPDAGDAKLLASLVGD